MKERINEAGSKETTKRKAELIMKMQYIGSDREYIREIMNEYRPWFVAINGFPIRTEENIEKRYEQEKLIEKNTELLQKMENLNREEIKNFNKKYGFPDQKDDTNPPYQKDN